MDPWWIIHTDKEDEPAYYIGLEVSLAKKKVPSGKIEALWKKIGNHLNLVCSSWAFVGGIHNGVGLGTPLVLKVCMAYNPWLMVFLPPILAFHLSYEGKDTPMEVQLLGVGPVCVPWEAWKNMDRPLSGFWAGIKKFLPTHPEEPLTFGIQRKGGLEQQWRGWLARLVALDMLLAYKREGDKGLLTLKPLGKVDEGVIAFVTWGLTCWGSIFLI